MIARRASRASFLPDRPEVSDRVRDRKLVLRLFEAHARAMGVEGKMLDDWLTAAERSWGTSAEPGGVAALRAALAVLDGFPVGKVRRGFPEGRMQE